VYIYGSYRKIKNWGITFLDHPVYVTSTCYCSKFGRMNRLTPNTYCIWRPCPNNVRESPHIPYNARN